jgi:hypothetical protein
MLTLIVNRGKVTWRYFKVLIKVNCHILKLILHEAASMNLSLSLTFTDFGYIQK